jgi:hypothetical protein
MNEQTANRFRAGDLVKIDQQRARVVGPAGFNGDNWHELELLDDYYLVPDGQRARGLIKTAQRFASDASLEPLAADGVAPHRIDGQFYAVSPRGIAYGPPTDREGAERVIANRCRGGDGTGWRIVTVEDLAPHIHEFDEELQSA